MPVPKENTIDTTLVHNRDVQTSNASSFVPYRRGAQLLEAKINGANMQLWSKPLFTVLLCIDL